MFENENKNVFNNTQFDNQFSNSYETTVSGVENVTRKGRGKKAALIGGISAVVLAGGSVTAYAASDTVKNQVKLRLSKPEKYYAWVNEKNSKTLGEKVSDYYKKRLEQYEQGQSVDVSLSYEPSQTAKDFATNNLGGSESDEMRQLINIIDNTDKYAFTVSGKTKKGSVNSNAGFEMDGKRILSVDVASDAQSMDYFFRIPELKEQWICLDLDEDDSSLRGVSSSILNTYKAALDDPSTFITPEEIEEEVNRYVTVWNDFVEEVKVEKSESIDICDIQVKYTVATVDITDKDADRLALEFAKEMKNDKVIRNIVVNKMGECDDDDEFADKLDDVIKSLEEDLEEDDYDNDIVFSMDTYIDATGTIRGFGFSDDDDESLTALIGKDGDNIRGEIVSVSDGEKEFGAKLNAVAKKKVFTGDITFDFCDYDYHYDEDEDDYVKDKVNKDVVLSFSDVELKDEDKLLFSGDFTLDIPKVDPIKISFDTDGNREVISYDLRIKDTDYGKIRLSYAYDYGVKVDLPDKSGAFVLDPETMDDLDIDDYINEKDLTAFVKLTLEDIGFDKASASSAANSFTEGYERRKAYSSKWEDDDYDYDWDDDEEDYDWDDDDDDYDWDSSGNFSFEFDPSEYNYEDYKDNMTEEEFNEWMKLMEEFSNKAS
ncbi:DUF6583 family protein [Ruminococcus sp.]|uniref:DUF6583 family protein n=1 Tax=Ruminococcus sp. TaxID=41978 RepID=UPI0025E71860|nr:DUF6583 family protein [Ruminococcus sp.]